MEQLEYLEQLNFLLLQTNILRFSGKNTILDLHRYYFSPDYIYIYPVPLSKDRNLLRKSSPTQSGHTLATPREFRISLSSGAKLKGTGEVCRAKCKI